MSNNDRHHQSHNHGDKGGSSQGTLDDPTSRLETNNKLYIPTEADSLDHSSPSGDGHDISVTPYPVYGIDLNHTGMHHYRHLIMTNHMIIYQSCR